MLYTREIRSPASSTRRNLSLIIGQALPGGAIFLAVLPTNEYNCTDLQKVPTKWEPVGHPALVVRTGPDRGRNGASVNPRAGSLIADFRLASRSRELIIGGQGTLGPGRARTGVLPWVLHP